MHNEFINAGILGIIEGVTEFLPISSTGHLIIAEKFFPLHAGFSEMFEVVIQLGAILSVVIFFRAELFPPLRLDSPEKKEKFRLVMLLWSKSAVAVIPALVIGAIFGEEIKECLFNPWVVAAALLVGGIILILIERKRRTPKFTDIPGMSFLTALLIGVAQCLAMVPGTSRSAATIIGAMLFGASRKAAAEFSFFLAIPTMAAVSAYSLLKYKTVLTATEWIILGIGFAVSFFTAWGVIAVFMDYIKTRTFSVFGYYRIILSIAVIGYFLFLNK